MMIPFAAVFTSDAPSQKMTDSTQVQISPETRSAPGPTKATPIVVKIAMLLFFFCFFGGIATTIVMALAGQIGGTVLLLGVTVYGVTSRRLIIISGKRQKIVQSLYLGNIGDIRMKEWPDGLGTISFGPTPSWPYSNFFSNTILFLENISEPRTVFQIICEAQRN